MAELNGHDDVAAVRVSRSGGLAGRSVAGAITADDDRWPRALDLVAAVEWTRVTTSRVTDPDHFVYDFDVPGVQVTVQERDLDVPLAALADLVLDTSR